MPSIRAALALVSLAAGTLTAATFTLAPAAQAATLTHDGVRAVTPSSNTVYNGGKATVRPNLRITSGAKRQVTARGIRAYRGAKLVARGSSVRLPAGTYRLATTMTYRSWRDVRVAHTTRTLHRGNAARDTQCKVTRIDSSVNGGVDPAYGEIAQARCYNAEFPGQGVTHSGPVSDYDCYGYCSVGDQFATDEIDFRSYNSVKTTYTTTRKYAKARNYTFAKRTFSVRNGGHRHVYTGSESGKTNYFSIPGGTKWRANYSYDCSSFGLSGNWIIDLHRKGSSVLDDENLDNVIEYYDSGTYRFSGGGTYRFEVITECDWNITVLWK